MAQQGAKSGQEKHCSLCFDLLKDPVTTSCGHSFCLGCVQSHCDEENQTGTGPGCPQCGQGLVSWPVPAKNTTEEPGASPEPADVDCDRTKVKDPPQECLESSAETEVDSIDLPKTRAEFLKYSCEITLDPNTVQTRLLLSDGNRRASQAEEQQEYPSHPERFIDGSQVLSKESLTGRHYWEVERSGGAVSVAVSYKDVSRTGTESIFGCNYKSWALDCFDNRYLVRHMYITAAKPHPVSPRVGVYLDHGAGILSFYSVSETMDLLHTVRTTFNQPLHAGLWVHGHTSSAVVCHEDSS